MPDVSSSVMPDLIGHLPLRSPSSFDADYWRSVEGPRHSVSLPDFTMPGQKEEA